MVGASKILTVSYGTFSCTLEGFDEPFNTMKAIAEYFRDLAADDRYFGAEPPQPDAEMLHRIAEREIQRRVEAKVQRNGVILRQTEVETEEPAPAALADTEVAETEAGETLEAAPVPQIAAEAPAPAATFEVPHRADPVSESVAAKLQRIRAAVATARAAAAHTPEPQAEEAEEIAPPQPVAETPAEAPVAETPGSDFGFALDISGPLSSEETEQIAAAEAAIAEEPSEIEAEAAPQEQPLAVAEEEAEPAEEESVDLEEIERQARMQRRIERRAARAAEAQARAEIEAQQAAQAEAEAEAAQEAEVPESPAEVPFEPIVAAEPAPLPEAAPEQPEPVAEILATEEPEEDLPAEAAPAAEAPAEPPRPMIRARVIKVRRPEPGALPIIELQEPPAAEPVPEDADTIAASVAAQLATEAPAASAPEPVSALTPEQEADLMAELAALAEDLGEAEDWNAPAEPQPAPVAAVDPDEFADGDYSEVIVDAEDFDADMAAKLEAALAEPAPVAETAQPVEAEIQAEPEFIEPETMPVEADAEADYAEVLVDEEETCADMATQPSENAAPAPELSDEAVALDAPEITPAVDPHAFADGDYAEVRLDSEALAEEAEEIAEAAIAAAETAAPDAALIADPVEPPAAEAELEAGEDAIAALVAQASEAPEAIEAETPEEGVVETEVAAEVETQVTLAVEPPAEPEPEPSAALPLRITPAAKKLPEEDLSRLMTEADAQMAGPENRRRISAIAHLKAAVAATVAERRLGGGSAASDETQPYREDLHQAVRPRRPVGAGHHGGATTARPTPVEARMAPLVLVSEQRVDRSAAEVQAETPAIRPRRVSSASLHVSEEIEGFDEPETEAEAAPSATEAASFAEFAESLGTQGLSDLLEAAAAYTAQVEGRPHFSPPQIMRKLSAIGSEGEFSREDRLRVFGRLLRQGKIAKVKRGQYAITEASRYFDKRA